MIQEVRLEDEAKFDFMTYTEEVITERAIPMAEDGLLSVHRKILWTMEEVMKLTSKDKVKKSASIVGTTLATSYFHGDSSCYGAMCKMAQPYLMRYPLVDGSASNFGSQEQNGTEAAARYTDARPTVYADLMMKDFKKNVVPLKETYNGEYMEPVMLPGFFPNAIVNGGQYIAVGMAHKSPPHNLTEACNAIIARLEKNDSLTVDELMEHIKGPDFPLGGTIINSKLIKEALRTGHSVSSLKIRGDYTIEGNKIIFHTIPYGVYRMQIKEALADPKKITKFEEILADFADESNLGVNRLVFEVKKGVDVNAALNLIFALTPLQTTFSYNLNYIVNGTPKLCSMMDLIDVYVSHQTNILRAIATYDKDKAEKRKHIIDGLLLVIADIDNAIKLIKESDDKTAAKKKLINDFSIDEVQAEAVLEMKLSRLTKLDKEDLLKELQEKIDIITECTKILVDDIYCNGKLIEKVKELRDKYGDERRTKLDDIVEVKPAKEVAEIVPENCVVVINAGGGIKRVASTSFRTQKKGGKGTKSKDDIIVSVIKTNTLDKLLVFTNKGNMYQLAVGAVPGDGKYVPIRGFIKTEDVTESPILIYSIQHDSAPKYLITLTKGGMIKKTNLSEYLSTNRKSGISAVKLLDRDSIVSVALLDEEELIVVTKNGKAIRFGSTEVSATGRATKGVKAINLDDGDEVVDMAIIRDPSDKLAVFTSAGLGKRVDLSSFTVQKRGGKGIQISKTEVADVAMVSDEDIVYIAGATSSICVSGSDIPVTERTATGNQMIKGTKIVDVTKV